MLAQEFSKPRFLCLGKGPGRWRTRRSAILAQQGQGSLHDRNVRSAHFLRAELLEGANAVNEYQDLNVVSHFKCGVNLSGTLWLDVYEAGREPAAPTA